MAYNPFLLKFLFLFLLNVYLSIFRGEKLLKTVILKSITFRKSTALIITSHNQPQNVHSNNTTELKHDISSECQE